MYVCFIDQKGKTRVHQNSITDSEILFDIILPFLEDVVTCIECIFFMYWIAEPVAQALYLLTKNGRKENLGPILRSIIFS